MTVENPVLVNVMRGSTIESRHRGAVAVVDPDGKIVLALGDIDAPVFPRSAVKALQALPLIESGAADRYALSDMEIALACASHNGEERHVTVAAGMLAKAGLDLSALECGTHWPSSDKAARRLAAGNAMPSALHNNCSGKHSGFLCVCCNDGKDPAGYVKAGHGLQQDIRGVLEDMTGAAHTIDNRGTDGCSIPTYAVPLRSLAHAFAKFTSGVGLGQERAKAAQRISRAIAAAPEMIAGEGKFDTGVMQIFGEDALIKVGAEGVYCGALAKSGFGVAIKADDGSVRAAEVMMAAVLNRFLDMSEVQAMHFEPFLNLVMRNWNGIHVGGLEASEAFNRG